MFDQFNDDSPYISLPYLMTELSLRQLTIMHVLKVTNIGTGAIHHVMLLADMRYVCDCGMSMNVGIPCRHYFRVLQAVRELPFHIALIRSRWYQDPDLDISQIEPILLNSTIPDRNRDQITVSDLPASLRNNPLATTGGPPIIAFQNGVSRNSHVPPPTQTLSSRQVYHEMQAALRPLMNGVETREQLLHVLENLRSVRYVPSIA